MIKMVIKTNATFLLGGPSIGMVEVARLRHEFRATYNREPNMIKMSPLAWRRLITSTDTIRQPMPVAKIMGMDFDIDPKYEEGEWRVGIIEMRKEVRP